MRQKTEHEMLIYMESIKIKSRDFLIKHRLKETSFSRRRKMFFEDIVWFMLNSVKRSTQIELTEYMRFFKINKNITKSAYCQQRMNLMYTAFVELNEDLVNGFYKIGDFKTWSGFRLISIDGSTLILPSSNQLRTDFGVNSKMNNVPMARITTVYDLLNEIIIDSSIQPNNTGEILMAVEQTKKLKKGDLLILDRGFAASWFFYSMIQQNINFIIRLPKGFSNEVDDFWESKDCSKIIELNKMPWKSRKRVGDVDPFKFRIVKVILDNGESEVLATSLIDEIKHPAQLFKELYSLRWGIETNYNHLKNHIELGNFTGYTTHVIMQDFYANLLISNMQTIVCKDAQKRLDENKKGLKHKYKINRNLSLGYMKNRVIKILMNNNPKQYEELIKLFLNEPSPIRPDRQFSRNTKRHKRRFYINQKKSV